MQSQFSKKRRGEERRGEEDMQGVLVAEQDVTATYHLVVFPLVSFLCNSCSKAFPTKN